MKTIDMRQCTDEFAKNISAYGKVKYITFKNEDYSVTIDSINHFKKNFDNIYIEAGFIIPELKSGDMVRIIPSYEKFNLYSKVIFEEEAVEEGFYKLRCINKKIGTTTKLEYIFKEVEYNYVLKFQNPSTKQIHERHCMISPLVCSGKACETQGYEIQLPIDEETKLFHGNSRFLIGTENHEPIAYKIIQINSITNQDELIIRVERDQLHMNDNYDLMIADYKEDDSPLLGLCEILFNGEPVLKVCGAAKVFTAMFKDRYGKKISEIIPHWNLDFTDFPELSGRIFIDEESGDEIKIRTTDNRELVDKHFSLKLYADSEDYGYFEKSIEIKLINLW